MSKVNGVKVTKPRPKMAPALDGDQRDEIKASVREALEEQAGMAAIELGALGRTEVGWAAYRFAKEVLGDGQPERPNSWLVAQLKEFGEHRRKCSVSRALRENRMCPPCDCGWQEVVSEIDSR